MAKAERPAPVSILYGRRQQEYNFDEYLAAGHIDTIKRLLGGDAEVFISEFDLARDSDINLGEALDLVSTPVLWGKTPLVIIREAQIAFAAREEARTRFTPFFERATELAKSRNAAGHLVLVAKGFEIRKGSDRPSISWDKASALFDAVEKAGWALKCLPPYESGLRTILMQHAREKGVRLLPDAADALLAAVGDNQMALIEELGKIIGAVGETRNITAADVERLAAAWPDRDAFTFAERIVEGNTAAALEILRDLRQSPATRPLPVILGALKFKLLQYLTAAAAVEKGATPEQAAEAAKVFFSFRREFAARLRKHTTQSINAILQRALQCDVEVKTGSSDEGLALETFVVEASSGRCETRELVGRWLYEV